MQDVEQTIRQFVVENFLFGQEDRPIAGGDSFLEHGVIDSTGVLELVSFLETRFGLQIADSELVPDNLDSIDGAAAFVRRKSQRLAGNA
ncbi:MAG: acyl carrier protein [Burkholderiaceae bacterium]